MFGNVMEIPDNAERVEKRKAIITGGTEGIGRAIANELMNGEHAIAICARTREKIEEFTSNHSDVIARQIDLADRRLASEFVRESIEELAGLDVLILNAAVTGMAEDPDYTFRVNEVANVAMTRQAAEALKKNHGRVVFLSSSAKNVEGAEMYGKSKRRIEEWLVEFSRRPENEGIGIFSVIPGSCATKMQDDILTHGNGAVKERTERIIEAGALRDPEIVGRIVSKMALSGMKFNLETSEYDIPIEQCEVVTISDEAIEAEASLIIP
jgi:3-oxoacyl-[acyl-carrier protein] reductase